MKDYFLKIGISAFIAFVLIGQPMKASLKSEDFLDKASFSLNIPTNVLNDETLEESKEATPRILFLCTGNSCRSQIAEGWTSYLGKESVTVKSAGIKAHGLNPRAIRVMEESGIDITKQTSKVVTSDMIQWSNLVITVCGDADETCPMLPKGVRKLHWPISDPAKAIGNDEEIMSQFRSVSHEIHQRVVELLAMLK